MAIENPVTHNMDVSALVRRINRFMVELYKSASSGVSQMSQADIDRLESYLVALRTYRDFVLAQPHLDMPETHPSPIPLAAPVFEPMEVENESVNDWMIMLQRGRDELILSQSSRLSSTLMQYDSARFTALVDKCDALLQDYVKPATPLDLPETSPQEELSGPGRRTIGS